MCYTTSFRNIICYHNLHLYFKGSCVTQGGGTILYKKNWNLYIVLQRNALIDIKISIIDICYTNMAPIPKTLIFSLRHKWKIQ